MPGPFHSSELDVSGPLYSVHFRPIDRAYFGTPINRVYSSPEADAVGDADGACVGTAVGANDGTAVGDSVGA